MADEVTISNLALALLGDEATISDPGEGSTQAEHCQMFFPIARRSLLEMFPWDFATGSASLSLQAETVRGWQYAYAKPDLCLKVLAVLPPEAADDYSVSGVNRGVVQALDGTIFTLPNGYNQYQPQVFKTETSRVTGAQLILTNQSEADAIYISDVTNTDLFTPLFDESLVRLLATYIAGPIYKGKTGVEMSELMFKKFELFFARATASNAGQEMTDVQQSVPWIAGR